MILLIKYIYLNYKNKPQRNTPYLLTKIWDTLNIYHNRRAVEFFY